MNRGAGGFSIMTIPVDKDIMLPFLRSLSDGNVHSLKELYQVLAERGLIHRVFLQISKT
jgi:hypothetical protein